MAINYKLPKVQELDGLSILNTPLAADIALANGVLTIKDETGANAITIKACDLLGFRYSAANLTGTPNVVDVDLTAANLTAENIYSLTVSAPYVQNFFGGGQETKAVYVPRTYTVSSNGTIIPPVAPTIADLQAKFVAAINADASAYFTATAVAGDIVRITANSALAGQLFVETNVPGITAAMITNSTAWVAPVGTTTEVLGYVPNSTLVTGLYDRYIIEYRNVIRHNAVSGLGVIKKSTALVYLDSLNGGTAAAVTRLTSMLNGSWAATSLAQAANYQGCPAI